ncbi:uncharacterized protein BCR38DRAFT_445807 [Pseudomassariella vexata]|uniref:Rhodopsin domain-containing protein n=1 Tax=Pseudomassariella vexata TaxID=1141098 RepID=A0A1Y2DIU8_9PEZI|nr:uncharacterized protein BCR38DRAFT_445807 [Pseudomassariella vexata]ORY59168.1 hypothetical protein BCR38DRAFT_445807 [Pseudomassariella vexata]
MAEDNRGPQLVIVTLVLLVLCWVSVGLRCFSMSFVLNRFYAADWLTLVTLAAYTAYSSFALLGVHYGLGAHVADVPVEDRPKALLYKWAAEVAYVITAVLVKFIIGILLLRIFKGHFWQRITLWALLGVVSIYNAFYVFMIIFQCVPVQYFWYRYDPAQPVSGSCNKKLLAIVPTCISFFVNVMSDLILALLPVSVVWHAKMDRRTKISVSCVLALGSIASLATIARIPYTSQLLSNPDYLYNFTDIAIWSTVEIGLGLAASSLATLKPLFRRMKLFTTTRYETNSTWAGPESGTRRRTGTARSYVRSKPSTSANYGSQTHEKSVFSAKRRDFIELQGSMSYGSVITTITADRGGDDDYDEGRDTHPTASRHPTVHCTKSMSVNVQNFAPSRGTAGQPAGGYANMV